MSRTSTPALVENARRKEPSRQLGSHLPVSGLTETSFDGQDTRPLAIAGKKAALILTSPDQLLARSRDFLE
jgi:hypothetical protein